MLFHTIKAWPYQKVNDTGKLPLVARRGWLILSRLTPPAFHLYPTMLLTSFVRLILRLNSSRIASETFPGKFMWGSWPRSWCFRCWVSGWRRRGNSLQGVGAWPWEGLATWSPGYVLVSDVMIGGRLIMGFHDRCDESIVGQRTFWNSLVSYIFCSHE